MKKIPQWQWMVKGSLAAMSLLALAGCPGEESKVTPPLQQPRAEASGLVSDGVQQRIQVIVAKGAAGTARTTQTAEQGTYTLSLTDLTGPYLFANTTSPGGDPDLVILTAVTAGGGHVNVTPLTTLLTSQLLGLDPANSYGSFDSGPSVFNRVTAASVAAAQAEVTSLLQQTYGVQVKSGQSSFVEAAFSPVAGDPMFDTITALNAKLIAEGMTLTGLARDIAAGVRACDDGVVTISMGGTQSRFCALNKSTLPDENDATVLVYTFRNVRQEVLTVRMRDEVVVAVSFTTATGATLGCSAAACTGVSLGAVTTDLTRPVNFASVVLTGGGGALLTGSLLGAEPFVTLPPLPCTQNRLIVIFDDHEVIGDCVSANHPLAVDGTFGGPSGPGREAYTFQNNLDAQAPYPRLEVGLDTTTATPTVTYVFYADLDMDTFQQRNRYACQFAACNGVTIGAVTSGSSSGYPYQRFSVRLDNTVLTGMEADGTATGRSLTVRAAFNALRDEPPPTIEYPQQVPCTPGSDEVVAQAFNAALNLCLPQNDAPNGIFPRASFDMGAGDVQLLLSSELGEPIVVNLHDDAVVEVLVAFSSSTGEQFHCTADCVGVSVSAPDGQGERRVDFAGTVLRQVLNFPRPGDRTLTLTGSGLVVPPPVP